MANIATVDIDDTGNPVTLDLSALALQDREYTGVELAAFMQTQLNSKFGDDRFFDISAPANREFVLNHTQGAVQTVVAIDLGQAFPAPEQQLEVTKSSCQCHSGANQWRIGCWCCDSQLRRRGTKLCIYPN